MPMARTRTTLKALEQLLRGFSSPAVAYSGGLDSRLLAHIAGRAGLHPLLVHASGPHLTPAETKAVTAELTAPHVNAVIVTVDPLQVEQIARNGHDRCYHCKKYIYGALLDACSGRPLCDGTNASDTREYRPGQKALQECGIRSPYMELGIGKNDIRALAQYTGLARADQPARPCLLTRFAYGVRPRRQMLRRLGAAEDALAALGLREFRLRITSADGPPQLHISSAEHKRFGAQMKTVRTVLEEQGFTECTISAGQQLSGHYDRAAGLVPRRC